MKKVFLILALVSIVGVLLIAGCAKSDAECNKDSDCIPASPKVGLQYVCEDGKCDQKAFGNPASAYCIDEGGRLVIRTNAEGEYGVCVFDDGSECDEWEFFRQTCNKGEKFP